MNLYMKINDMEKKILKQLFYFRTTNTNGHSPLNYDYYVKSL